MEKKHRILLVATGGTIACSQTENGLSPALSAAKLAAGLPLLGESFELETVQPFSLDSTNMSPKNWCALAELIREEYDRFDGFVITHGTDTMGYAAAALSCLIPNSKKPVVLTGSMLPLTADNSDAPKNLSDAFIYALSDGASGVVVCFCGKIIDGRCAVKLRTDSPDAFESANRPLVGTVKGGVFSPISPTGSAAHIINTGNYRAQLDSRVCLIKLIPGNPASVLDVGGDIKAVVIECFGTGGLPDYGDGAYLKQLSRLVSRGVYVIAATQCVYGGSDIGLYEVGAQLLEHGVIDAKKMTSEYAVMRAMWALCNSSCKEEFAALFLTE